MALTRRVGMTLSLAAALSLPAVALASTSAHAAGSSDSAATQDFYTPPTDVPDEPGKLMKSEKFSALLNLKGKPTRLMYSSRDDSNKPVAVTGTYIEPNAKWSGSGPRPLVSFAVGTIGQGDQCAPSKMMKSMINFPGLGSVGVNYETIAINNLLAKGVAVVVTDYVGLGLSDRTHTYMNRDDQADAVLDAARAAFDVPDASVTDESKVATYGYSQGGGASGAAAEKAPKYAPELNLVGAYVGAPPADLENVLAGIDGSPIAGVAGYYVGGAASHPEVKNFIDANMNDAGRAMLAKVGVQCATNTVLELAGHKTNEWMKTGESLSVVMQRDKKFLDRVHAQLIGTMKPEVPVRLSTGIADDIVPHAQAKQLAKAWCEKGANVSYAPLNNHSMGKKSILNHAGPLLSDQGAARDWIVDRFEGKPVSSNCDGLSSMK